MNIHIIDLIIAGLIFGLFGAPFIFYCMGSIVLFLKSGRDMKITSKMKDDHNDTVRQLKKRYDRARRRFNKRMNKLQKILAKAEATR